MAVAPATTEDATMVLARCDALAAFSEEPARLTRRFATPALDAAMRTVGAWMQQAGMRVRRDSIGNLFGRYAADHADAKTLLLGSHLDSVRDAGRYDGPLGVLVALACVQRLHAAGRALPFAIEVVAFADEEGLRYHTAYLGSQVLAGRFDHQQLERADDAGVTMAAAIRAFGGDPAALDAARYPADDLRGYCEVHIEQGPVLEAHDLAVGVVTAIAGQSRVAMTVRGAAGHAGTVPMALRRDALAAAAEFVLAVEALALATPGLVATVGQLAIAAGASNVIPGEVALSLDVRHQHDSTRLAALDALHQQSSAMAQRRGVALTWTLVQAHDSVACDAGLTAQLAQAVAHTGQPVFMLPSGAGHDGAMLATITPIAMLFVRCAGGVSHNPAESVGVADVAVAIDVLDAMLAGLAALPQPEKAAHGSL